MALEDERNSTQRPSAAHADAIAPAMRQYGVAADSQLHVMGIQGSTVRRRAQAGIWERVAPGVLRVPGSAPTWHQSMMIACLSWRPPSLASHRAAARIWGLIDSAPIELLIPRGRRLRNRPGLIHYATAPPHEATILDSLPVTRLERTVLDLASVVPTPIVEEALDAALRRRLLTIRRLRSYMRECGGRPGIASLRHAVESRDGVIVPQSVLESRVLMLLDRAGLPPPSRQVAIHDEEGLVGIIDFAYPQERVEIEADGYRWHSGRTAWERDLTRRNRLTALGWFVLHVTWQDVDRRPEQFTNAARRALHRSSVSNSDQK